MNIVILGPPGSGKGTQSKKIADLYENIKVVDCGKLLRCTNLTDEMRSKMCSGGLLDDDFVISVVRHELSLILSKNYGFILDGFPRSAAQCHAFFDIIDNLETQISCVVKLELNDDIILQRLSTRLVCSRCDELFTLEKSVCTNCGATNYKRRSDDVDIKVIKERIDSYIRSETEIVNLFKKNGVKVLSVDSSCSVDEVTNDLRNQLLIFA